MLASKAESPIAWMLEGSFKSFRPAPWKASASISLIPEPNLTSERDVAFEKAPLPSTTVDSGIVHDVNELVFLKDLGPMI